MNIRFYSVQEMDPLDSFFSPPSGKVRLRRNPQVTRDGHFQTDVFLHKLYILLLLQYEVIN